MGFRSVVETATLRLTDGMTLILCIEPDGNPILLADCLLSTPLGDAAFELPSIGREHAKLPTVTGVRAATAGKKIVPINRTMFAAFAGNVARAHALIGRLRDIFGQETPSKDYLNVVLKGFLAPDVSLMIVLRHQGQIGFVQINCQSIRLPGVGKVWAAGSGIGSLKDLCRQLQRPLQDCMSFRPASCGLIACALCISGTLLGNEVWAGGTLVNSFGGFYELADCSGPEFRFVTEHVFVFWQFPSTNDAPPVAMKVMKRLPRQDPAEYFSIDLPLEENGGTRNERRYQIATGIDAPAVPPQTDKVELNALFQVNVLGVNVGSSHFGTMARVHHATNPIDHVIYFPETGSTLTRQIRLHYLKEYCDGLLPLARQIAGQSPHYVLRLPSG